MNEESGYTSIGCLIHTLQLVVKDEIMEFPAVKEALERGRKICSFANKSNVFCAELRKQQKLQLFSDETLLLIQDVPTRWNSTYDMVERLLELKPAIISSMANTNHELVELTKTNWNYLEKVKNVLQVFKESTEMLSLTNASMSQAIPIVTLIMKTLKTTLADHGVKNLKTALKNGMEHRFGNIEHHESYALATFLDPRFKGFLFQDPNCALEAKEKIAQKLEEMLTDDPSFHDNMEENVQASMNTEDESESSMNMEFGSPKPKRKRSILADTMEAIKKRAIYEQQNSPKTEVYTFLEHYSNSKTMEESSDVFAYWKSMSESTKPIERVAAKLAAYYLTPPPTSVDVERLFSTAGDIITNERNRLLPENASKILFLRENLPHVNFDY